MADLPVVAVITARAGSEQQVQQALSALVEPTRSEPGCISYDLLVSAADPAVAGDHLAQTPAIHPLRHVTGS
jgi:quinol monooxygenase YgiN